MLIIAAGAADVVPPVLGVDQPQVHFAWQADNGSVAVGQNVVVVGAGLVGTETAIQLAESGKQVTVVEMLPFELAMRGKGMLAAPAQARADQAGVAFLYEHVVQEICEAQVLIKDLQSGAQRKLPADTVLLAAGVRPRQELVEELRHTIAEGDVYIVGDLVSGGGTIGHATNTAFEVAAHI